MFINDIQFQSGTNTLKGTIFRHNDISAPSVLSLHGAGKSNRFRIRYLLEKLAKRDVSSLCFDFSGHGETTGSLAQSSLPLRRQEAISACEFIDKDKPLTVIGSSMGGHVAATLVDQLPIKTLILFCPAAYSEKAETVQFDERFSEIIRQPKSYLDSPAFKKIESFTGNLLIICGSNDQVIPKEILDIYLVKATNAAHKELLLIDGADHQIHPWLEQHADDLDAIIAKISRLIKTALPLEI